MKIICNLRHSDASPLAKVCTQMREAVNEAIDFHFNVTTPQPHTGAETPRGVRHSKRQKLEPAGSGASSFDLGTDRLECVLVEHTKRVLAVNPPPLNMQHGLVNAYLRVTTTALRLGA